MKIYYISYFLSCEMMKAHEEECECSKTPTGYKVQRQSTFGGKTTIVKASQILVADCLTRTDIISPIKAYTWYLMEEDKPAAKALLRGYLIARATAAKEEATKVFDTLMSKIQSHE